VASQRNSSAIGTAVAHPSIARQQGELQVMSRPTTQAVIAAIGCALLSTPSYSMDLSGSWATDASACDKIFVKNGKKASFREDSDTHGSGFIIEGNQIKGQTANCTIKLRREDGAVIHMIAACASEVMLSDVQVSVKVTNDKTLTRFFPGMPDISIKYFRCSL
jgi:hypothetical protein